VEQIGRNLGIQFEPRVVEALCDAVEVGLGSTQEQPDFAQHLEAGFDPSLIRKTLRELRHQLNAPTLRQPAVVIDAARDQV
jgi:hypothetical protein